MANLLKYIEPNKIQGNAIPKLSPSEETTINPLLKYMDTSTETKIPTAAETTTNPLIKYMTGETVQPQQTPQQKTQSELKGKHIGLFVYQPPGTRLMDVPEEKQFKISTLGKNVLRDLVISIPMMAKGMGDWISQAAKQTVNEKRYWPITGKPVDPGGIAVGPVFLWNLIFRPGRETVEKFMHKDTALEALKSYYQHPVLGPAGDVGSVLLPVMLTKGMMPKAKAYPFAAKEGLMSGPLAPPEPSLASELVKKAYDKFKDSPRFLRFKEYVGLLPEQVDYFNLRYNYELQRAEMMSKAAKGELYTTLKKFTPAENESFILNLEIAKPATAESAALLKKAGISIPEQTVNVAKAIELWNKSAQEGLNYMTSATEKTLFKGGSRGKLLTKSAILKGKAEFKKSLILEAKNFRQEVKKLGGISEEAAKPYSGIIPKEVIKKGGLTLEEISAKLKVTPEQAVSKLLKFSQMQKVFTDLAIEKLTKKFGYKVPIGVEPGKPRGDFIAEARWQPTIQALEAKLGTKFTIAELQDLGFNEPSYYHHAFPKDYQFRSRAYTGPSYSPGIWKERMGKEGYSREPLVSIKEYDYQLIKYKALNDFKDYVFDQFGQKLVTGNPAQASQISSGSLVKYGKGKVLYETPEGMKIKVKTDMVIPRTVANEFNNMFAKTSRGEMFFRTYLDPITNAWKIPVLALSPRWVFNNIVGNFVLNTMGGVGPGGYLDAMGLTVKAKRLMSEAKKAGETLSYSDALIKLGVPERAAQGLYRGELGTMGEGLPITKMQKLAAGAKYIPDKVYKFNSTVESFFRTAHYMDKIGKGFSVKQAIASVNEFLFDYLNSSPLQKQVFKRIDPFWNWHKNIIRLAISYPVKYPQRYMLMQFYNKIGTDRYEDTMREAGVDPANVPDYYKNMIILPWKDSEGQDFYISLRGMDPLADITSVGIQSLHPLLKTYIEWQTGLKSYTMKPFTSPDSVYGKYEKVTPPMWRMILNNFPQFRVIEDVVRPYSIYDTGEPMITKWGEPVYTKNKLLSVLSIMGFKVTPRDIEEIYRNISEDEQAVRKRKSTYERALELFKQKQ